VLRHSCASLTCVHTARTDLNPAPARPGNCGCLAADSPG
jgi:hypothetical protein